MTGRRFALFLVLAILGGGCLGGCTGIVVGVFSPRPEPFIELPGQVQAEAGQITQLVARASGGVEWHPHTPGLSLFRLPDGSALVTAATPGRYEVMAWSARGGKPSPAATCIILVGGPIPPPVPPDPPRPPDPPKPPPIAGNRVLIVYETAELDRLPEKQRQVLFSRAVRDYLDSRCAPDGKVKAWRMWDKDVDASAEAKVWQDALQRPRTTLPWVWINGRTVYEGPLPNSPDEAMALFKKYLE